MLTQGGSSPSSGFVILSSLRLIRELKQTTTTTATRTSPNKRWWAKQWLCTCVIILCTFPWRPQHNNNVKWPSSASSTERGRRRLILRISIWNWTPSLHIWLKHVYRAIGVPSTSKQSRILLVKYKFIFTRRRPRRRRRRCLSSLMLTTPRQLVTT